MSDRFWAKIWIGGPMPDDLMLDFRQELYGAGLISKLNEALSDHMCDSGVLRFADNETFYGRFENLEEWLIINGIDFNRQSDGYGEYSPCLFMFRKAIGSKDFILDHDGQRVMRIDDVFRLIDQNPGTSDLILKLKEEDGQNIPPLKSFFGSTVLRPIIADKLKRQNTDPMATNCAACGGQLTDHGLGPAYKHCPKCEP